MVKNPIVSVSIYSSNKPYWDKIFNTSHTVNTTINVDYNLIPKKSNIMIDCVCDSCSRNYKQRRSRDLSICGYCKTRKRLIGNSLGVKNKKHNEPDKTVLLNLISTGLNKTEISKKYGVSITTVNTWLKKYDINIPKYMGLKYHKNILEYNIDKNRIIEYISNSKYPPTISDISIYLNIPRSIVRNIISDNKISGIKSKFDIWKNDFEVILGRMPEFIKENETKTLKTIADEQFISIEQLKRAFSEMDILPRIHSYNKSKGELACREYIRSLSFNCDSYIFEKKYEIDCYVPEKQFGLEYCGEYWHRFEPSKNNKYYHQNKRKYFENKNISLMTIFESEWNNPIKQNILKSMISYRISATNIKHLGARECIVKEVSKSDSNNFHDFNHVSGSTISTYNLGLYYDNELLSVLSFVKSRFSKECEYEISRFSTKTFHSISGGFSKLFKFGRELYNFSSCLTYADLRFGAGKVYEKNGFKYIKDTLPNYFYYDKNIGNLESRMKYQKKKLIKYKEVYSPEKTEFDIMKELGYYRIYDCGNSKYIWIK